MFFYLLFYRNNNLSLFVFFVENLKTLKNVKIYSFYDDVDGGGGIVVVVVVVVDFGISFLLLTNLC